MSDAERVAALLEERPDLAGPLASLLEVDQEQDTWTFEDIPVESGPFGELVGREVVEKVDGEYRLADPEAVRAALSQDVAADASDTAAESGENGTASPSIGSPAVDVSRPTLAVDRRLVLALGGVLLFLALTRTVFAFPAVFRDQVVLSGNDPYYYRYWVEQLLASGGDISPSALPGAVAKGEPLMVTTLWAASALLGGSVAAAGWVLAWYPVVSAVVAGAALYLLTTRVTRDRRVGLAAVVMLATLPGHGYRTSLGFADHHAFDFIWLALALLALHSVLARTDSWRAPGTWLAAGGLGITVAAQVLAWEAAPLLIAPIAVAAAALVLVDVRLDRDPLLWGVPLLVALGLASLLTLGVHETFNWHTIVVTAAPPLLFGGVAVVVALGAAAARVDLSWRVVAGGYVGVAVAGLLGVRYGLPDFWAEASSGVQRIIAPRDIVETAPLFGEGAGWLLLFGLLLAVGVAYLAWATRALVRGERRWAASAAYAWVLLGLSFFSIRFGGEASIPLAVFAALGFVHIAERVDLATRPAPFREGAARAQADGGPRPGDRRPGDEDSLVDFEWPDGRAFASLVVLGLLLCGLGLMQVPIKTGQLTITDETYETATEIDAYAGEYNLSDDENYVLSEWGRNRVYNYFVSGESQSYSYARQQYPQVLDAQPGSAPPGRVGFVVVDPGGNWSEGSVHDHLMSYGEGASGLGHYRAVARTGETRAFRTVPGANVTGQLEANVTTATLVTEVSVPGWEFAYARETNVTNGTYSARVAHPGQYRVLADGQERATLVVPEEAVLNGTRVDAGGAGGEG
ncbi:MAG: STT3 domain-containing protein [Haloarculaceae archaeon]